MFHASILNTQSKEVVQFSDASEEEAKKWLKYNIPSLDIASLKLNSKMNFGVYSASLQGDAPELPDVEPEKPPVLPVERVLPDDLPDIESMTAADVIAFIDITENREVLELMREVEQAAKKRRTVLDALNAKLGG